MPIGTPSTPTNGAARPPQPAISSRERIGGFGATRDIGYGSGGWGTSDRPILLPVSIDDATRLYGMTLYEEMLCDYQVKSSFDRLKQGTLNGPLKVIPAVQAAPGEEPDGDANLAKEIADFCQWNMDRLDIPLPDVLDEWLDGLAYGCILSEKVWSRELVDGRRAYRQIKPRPWWSWRFEVDRFGNVMWIEPAGRSGREDPSARIAREDVAIFTWGGKRGDPRGTSVFRAAYLPWNYKRQNYPEHFKFLRRMAVPIPVGKAPPEPWTFAPRDSNGHETDGFEFLLKFFKSLENGSCIVLPNGTEVDYLEPRTEGGAFLAAFEKYDRAIATAIIGSARSTMEAEHGSRADSETSQDDVGTLCRFVGGKIGRTLQWDVLYPLVLENWGPEVADKFTPTIPVGAVEHQDKAGLIGAWTSAGWKLHTKHLAKIDAELDLDPRTEQDILAEEEKAAERAAAMGLPAKGAAGKPAEAGDDAEPPTPPKGKPATFALDAPLAPWHDADVIEAYAWVRRMFPSAAAMRRWEKGTESDDNRRVILGYIMDDAKARLVVDAEALMRELATFGESAEFASPFETVSRWRDGAARLLRRAYLAGALALMGPSELSSSEWEALGGANTEQVEFLDGFAGDILSGKQPRDGTLPARAGLYGASVWNVSQNVTVARAQADGMTRYRSVHVGPDKPCATCRRENAKGWQAIGTLVPIGKRDCKANDHCHWEFKGGGR